MAPGDGTAVVRALLDGGVITPADLHAALRDWERATAGTTHAQYLDTVLARCPTRSLSTYKTNFRRLADRFADRDVADVTDTELAALAADIRRAAAARRGAGIGGERGFVHAARFWYRCAVTDGLRGDNAARNVPLPARQRRVRRALEDDELDALYRSVTATSHDPHLDVLLLDFHRETAARRAGAVNLRLTDLNPGRSAVLLREKYGHEREVPASGDLMDRLTGHATGRGATQPTDPVFRGGRGAPISRRRYNTIFERVQRDQPWAARLGVSIHWLRHTTLTDIARATNTRIAAAYAGHEDRTVTDLYTTPTWDDLVYAHDQVFPGYPCKR